MEARPHPPSFKNQPVQVFDYNHRPMLPPPPPWDMPHPPPPFPPFLPRMGGPFPFPPDPRMPLPFPPRGPLPPDMPPPIPYFDLPAGILVMVVPVSHAHFQLI